METLRTDVVMLGLNLSRPAALPFGNFHDPSPRAQDYKIRHAFARTPYYGAYMTDLVKGVVMRESNDLLRHLSARPDLIRDNVERFVEELLDLGGVAPVLIAFGKATHRLAAKHLPPRSYTRLIGVTHYSHYLSKEDYRGRVLAGLGAQIPFGKVTAAAPG